MLNCRVGRAIAQLWNAQPTTFQYDLNIKMKAGMGDVNWTE